MVERTAHNGFVVGSNPTKPIKYILIKILLYIYINKMKLKLKEFNALKIANHLYNHRLIFFFQGVNLKTKSWINIEQYFNEKKLKYYQLNNSIAGLYLKNSIFKNITPLINNNNFFVFIDSRIKSNFNSKHFLNLDSGFYALLTKFNNNFYFLNKKFFTAGLNYNILIKKFTFLLLRNSTMPIKSLKKISKLSKSK